MSRRHFGHIYDWREVDDWAGRAHRPLFATASQPISDSGRGKLSLPWKILKRVAGVFPIRRQTGPDCVSMAWALGVDIVAAVEIAVHQDAERWAGTTATEPIYGGSRVEIGRGRLGNGGGSMGSWAARCVSELGTVVRGRYMTIDLSKYSGKRAIEWGRPKNGVPDALEPIMRRHLIRSTSLVTTYHQAVDAIANGFPVIVCSSQGFTSRRDAQGFAKPKGRWAHAMTFIGADDRPKRPALLCMNSWGANWITGPKRDQPDGSFWVDADTAERMLARNSDSFTLSQFEGYPAQKINHNLGGLTNGRQSLAV